jgi:riboflavin kinase/FMN adenylyltransferase
MSGGFNEFRVFRSLAEIPQGFGPTAVAIGNFDGMHVGHRQIMRRLLAVSREPKLVPIKLVPMVLTFDPHPARVLAPERAPKLLMTMEQRLRAMREEGIEAAFLLPFSLEFARQSPEEFAQEVLKGALNARAVHVGEDFRFGYKQAGTIETLRALGSRMGFAVEAVPTVGRRGERISSSAIRRLVEEGRVSRACRMLGGPFALEGNVVPGHGIGSRQTVPTLNLAPENEVLPARGVYVTRTADLESGRKWHSITNVGYRPTFNGEGLTIETFLLDPLTGPSPSRLEVRFLTFVRPEIRFDSPEALKTQIVKDVAVANRLHRRLAKQGVG